MQQEVPTEPTGVVVDTTVLSKNVHRQNAYRDSETETREVVFSEQDVTLSLCVILVPESSSGNRTCDYFYHFTCDDEGGALEANAFAKVMAKVKIATSY